MQRTREGAYSEGTSSQVVVWRNDKIAQSESNLANHESTTMRLTLGPPRQVVGSNVALEDDGEVDCDTNTSTGTKVSLASRERVGTKRRRDVRAGTA